MSRATTDEPIEMLFVLWTRVNPRNHAFGDGPNPPRLSGNFGGCSAPLQIYCNSKSTENSDILAVQYTYKLYIVYNGSLYLSLRPKSQTLVFDQKFGQRPN